MEMVECLVVSAGEAWEVTEPVSERGVFATAAHEGVVPCAYFDLVGVRTIYIGHTDAAGEPSTSSVPLAMPETREALDEALQAAFDVFERDLLKYAGAVDAFMGPMKPHERDGWTSWHFNTGGVFTSSAVKLWKQGKKAEAVQVMRQWNKVTIGGKKVVSSALTKRRNEEAAMILKGRYPETPVAVWPTNSLGQVTWKAIDMLDFEEVKRLSSEPGFFERLWTLIERWKWFRRK